MKLPQLSSSRKSFPLSTARGVSREAQRVNEWYEKQKPELEAAEQEFQKLSGEAGSYMEKYVPYIIHKLHRERKVLMWVVGGLLAAYLLLTVAHLFGWTVNQVTSEGEMLVQNVEGQMGRSGAGSDASTSATGKQKVGKGSVTNYSVKGIDVSHWDGDIDWAALASEKLDFIFIKATQGSQTVDAKFASNWAAAKSKKLLRGAYHFYDPAKDPKEQADHFLNTVTFEKGDLLPVLDIETSGSVDKQKLADDIQVWLDEVTKKVGHKPIIYTYKQFWDDNIKGNKFGHYYLWLAEYEQAHLPYLPSDWDEWEFWQYSSTGEVKGINSSKVDLNVFSGSKHQLKRYTIR